MQLTWTGECSAWECDELGHMNMRFYLYKVAQGRAMMALRLGLPLADLLPRHVHIRYLGEARPGYPLRLRSGFIDRAGQGAQLFHALEHSDGRPAATIVEAPSKPITLAQIPDDWQTQLPDYARARGFDVSEDLDPFDRDAAKSLGFTFLGCGVFQPREAGPDSCISAEALLGRVTETVGHFPQAWPEHQIAENYGKISGVLLEARMKIFAAARPGQGYEFYSGILNANAKIRTLRHVIVDAVTGAPIMTMIGVLGVMDLTARKLLNVDEKIVAKLNAITLSI